MLLGYDFGTIRLRNALKNAAGILFFFFGKVQVVECDLMEVRREVYCIFNICLRVLFLLWCVCSSVAKGETVA